MNQNNQVDLVWATASEINNDYFEVEHLDNAGKWHVVAHTLGAGHSTQRIDYLDLHRLPHSGINYYRLQQYDYNGDQSTSQIESIWVDDISDFTVSPNPTKGDVVIRFDSEKINSEDIVIYSQVGQTVDVGRVSVQEDNNVIHLQLHNLSAGIYWVTAGAHKTKIIKI